MAQANYLTAHDPLSLDRIRNMLIRLEDTIIFALIERAQFAHNPKIYVRGAFPQLTEAGCDGSWLEWFLKETEIFHGACGAQLVPFTRLLTMTNSQGAAVYQVCTACSWQFQ